MSTPLADPQNIAAQAFWAQHPDVRDEAFAKFRVEKPVFWSGPAESDLLPPEENIHGFWSLTKYDDIQAASRNAAVFSSASGITMEDFSPEMTEIAQSFIAMDAPRHTQLRGITMDAFKPGNMRKLEGWVRGHAKDLIDEMTHLGSGDFVDLVAEPMPGRIFGSFFGLHEGDQHQETIRAAQDLLSYNDPVVTGGTDPLEHFVNCVMTLRLTAAELAEERRENPGEDLMTWLVQAEFEGEKMTDDEIGAFFVLLAVAANDTSRHAAAGALYAFTRFKDQRALLVEDVPGRIDSAVEEVIRWVSPLIHMRRTAKADIEVRGQQIKAGDKVVLWYCSSNRDEKYWGNPFDFDIFRSPHRHPGFGGGGPHYCLGAAVARTTLKSLLSEIYTRIPDIEAPDPDFLVANFINGIRTLPAEWTPEAR
ncbi:MAG: cytochrome P450 [Baekduiaceae bacterium]